MDVTVIIANWNTTEWVAHKSACTVVATEPDCGLIVVDQGSTDGAVEFLTGMVRRHPHNARVVLYGKNYGPAKAGNDGIRISRGKYICILNSDAWVEPGCLRKMMQTLEADETIGMTGPMCNNISSSQGSAKPCNRANFEMPAGYVMPFVCVMIPRRVIEKIGLLAERFHMGGSEDIDYCNRIRAAGYRIVVTGNAFCWHALSQAYRANNVDVGRANWEMSRLLDKKEPIQKL